MARRIKEDPAVHQGRIAMAAARLFLIKGIENTTTDEIAKEAGYSKATLYVYFKNKDELVDYIALLSMTELRDALLEIGENPADAKDAFFKICYALCRYRSAYPAFFDRSLQYIQIDRTEGSDTFLHQTYLVGEEINGAITAYLENGEKAGKLKRFGNKPEMIMAIWGMISGVIKLADEKAEYISVAAGLSKEMFLQNNFARIYQMIGCD